ncbi:chitin deacetylase [Coprinopsis sp. MPI-PUGE-AT-0042]|nr:chitin deacetylase [Coprinopsis sp. MPI-PUGE-AT-0042]
MYWSQTSLCLFFVLASTQAAALVIRAIGGPLPGSLSLRHDIDKRQADGIGLAPVVTKCTEPNTVALTFDDGPFIYLNELVDTLNKAGAKGTFFFNGNNWGCIYDEANAARVKHAYDHGHQIASHTWSHAHLASLNQIQLNWEFWLIEEAILKITGAFPAFTRPPFGEYDNDVLQVARFHGQTIVNWDFDSRDTSGASAAQSIQNYRALVANHPPSALTLNHEINESTVRVLIPGIISSLQDAGYRLVTVAECLGVEPYIWVEEPQERDDTWQCRRRA